MPKVTVHKGASDAREYVRDDEGVVVETDQGPVGEDAEEYDEEVETSPGTSSSTSGGKLRKKDRRS